MELVNYNSKNQSIKQIQIYFMFQHEMEKPMAKRQRMTKSSSKRSFKKGMGTKSKNLTQAPARGGYRL